jgi:UDP-2,3-diacylglucosamine pyrophosphatase LpxH
MAAGNRIQEAYDNAKRLRFTDDDKFIIFSDVHRGVNDWGDDFAKNQLLYFHAMESYFDNGFTYIENGDGDELGEIWNFNRILRSHKHIFMLLRKFHRKERLYMIHGNHDMVRKFFNQVKRTLHSFINDRTDKEEELFDEIKVHSGIVLEYGDTGKEILIIHGHQEDWFNYYFWWIGRLFLPVWRGVGQKILGIKDPTSPAQNWSKRSKLEDKMINWLTHKPYILIVGHTHRSKYPSIHESGSGYSDKYFNCGSCVHPRCITGIEIKNGEIELVKWWQNTKPVDDDPFDRVMLIDRKSMMQDVGGKPIKIADL